MEFLNRTFVKFEQKHSTFYASLFFAIAAVVMPNTGLVDKAFLVAFIYLMVRYGQRILISEKYTSISILCFTIVITFAISLDKATNYPEHNYLLIKFPLYVLLFVVQLQILRTIINPKTWVFSAFCLILIYTPVVQVPSDFARQIIGNLLVDTKSPSYFTKIQLNKIYTVQYNDVRKVIYYQLTTEGYDEEWDLFVSGDGSMDRQYVSELYAIRLWRRYIGNA
jgi:hypothetical protein